MNTLTTIEQRIEVKIQRLVVLVVYVLVNIFHLTYKLINLVINYITFNMTKLF